MRFVVDHDRHDLRIERACLGGGGGAAMAFQCVAVERLAIEAVFAGDRFRAVELAEFGDAEARGDALADRADPNAFPFCGATCWRTSARGSCFRRRPR
jgi:FAD/FMN-containing dehydrogenase